MKPYYCVRNDSKVSGKPFRVNVFDGVTFYSLGKAFATKAEALEACSKDGKGYPVRCALWDNLPQN